VNPFIATLKQGSLNRRELALKALAGLAGGAIGWLPIELVTHNAHLGQAPTTFDTIALYVTQAIEAGLIGGFITAATTAVDGVSIRLTPPAQRLLIRGFLICAGLSFIATYFSNYVFNLVLYSGGVGFDSNGQLVTGSVATLVLARTIGWAIDGALVGAGVGLATFVMQNAAKGAVGGFAGGFIGGLTFDLINGITGGGLLARLIGFSLIGFAIGLLIGLVQELTKAAWVTVTQGRLKGRQYRIEGARASIGRAEENPVGLFGDASVQARHAIVERSGDAYVLKNLAVKEGTMVNGSRIESVELHDGDRINIGGYELVFHLRQEAASAPARAQFQTPTTGSRPGEPYLVDGNGNTFPLRAGMVTRMGRALDNEIVVGHSSVSRHHATIEASNGAVSIKDLNSQNGTFVGGKRVTDAPLRNGDAVRLGDAQFTFRG